MNKVFAIAAIASLTSMMSVSALAAEAPLQMNVFNLSESALVKVTENGQPAVNVPVTIKGTTTKVLTTSANGTVTVQNYDNSAKTFTISITEPNGEVISTDRLISKS
jgi:anti-sigma factor RsiW